MKKETFEEFLQEGFIKLNEVGGVPITKDNCENMFEVWLEELQIDYLIKFADMYGQSCYLDG